MLSTSDGQTMISKSPGQRREQDMGRSSSDGRRALDLDVSHVGFMIYLLFIASIHSGRGMFYRKRL